jgi:hypothetical protein
MEARATRPRLVVGIIVDQMRYDYLARFWNGFTEGGFRRLAREGTAFAHCNYNYVPTETAPGHASIFTGTTPSVHGIIMNEWMDQHSIAAGKLRLHSSVEDSSQPWIGLPPQMGFGRGASPFRLDAPTVADQMKQATGGKSVTVGISLKDRSAILPAGKSADIAFWQDEITGNMCSSTYYPMASSGACSWVDSVNQAQTPLRYLLDTAGWTLLLPPSRYRASDALSDNRYECAFSGSDRTTFPHLLHPDSMRGCSEFRGTPWGNTFLKDFGKLVISHLQLGMDSIPDFLSISFTSTDIVAHFFGPDSREVEDTYYRLDRDLEDFLSFLDARIGKENVLVFLTADHGAASNPTYAIDHGEVGGWIEPAAMREKIRARLGDEPGKDSLLSVIRGHSIYLNRSLAARRNLRLDSLSRVVADVIRESPGVDQVMTASELLAMTTPTGPAQFLRNGFHQDRSGDVLYLASYGYQPSIFPPTDRRFKKGTSHSTHHEYDTHVPLLWWGSSVRPGKSDASVVITDIAPTVCKRLGIGIPGKCSGNAIPYLDDNPRSGQR